MRNIALFLLLFSFGCTRTVYVPTHTTRTVIDTVMSEVPDSATIRALLACDENNQVILRQLDETKGKLAEQIFRLDSGRIEIVTRWQTKYIDRVEYIQDTITVVQTKTEYIPVKHIPKLYRWSFWVLLVGVISIPVRWFIKRKLRL